MRPLRTLLAATVALVALAAPAAAHVSVQPAEADRGSDAELTFRVPNERDDAATVEVAVELPAEFERVEAADVDGWTATVDEGAVRWTGGRLEGEQSQSFTLTVGPLPAGDELVFRAVQTYDSGEVVRWVDESHDDDHPAPVLTLTGEAPTPTTVAETTTTSTSTTTVDDELAADTEEDEGLPAGGAIAVLVFVVIGITLYVLLRRRPDEE